MKIKPIKPFEYGYSAYKPEQYQGSMPMMFDDTHTQLQKMNRLMAHLAKMDQTLYKALRHIDNVGVITNENIKELENEIDIFTNAIRNELTVFEQNMLDYYMPTSVGTILDEWFENGKLTEIINEQVFTEITTKLDLEPIHVKEFGAVGDFTTDDTNAFIEALEFAANNNKILITAGFNYKVQDVTFPVNKKVVMDCTNSVIQRIATNSNSYDVFKLVGSKNVTIINPTIIGDRIEHIKSPSTDPNNVDGYAGEWGMGIGIYGCENIYIHNPTISQCWGDGIYIGGIDSARNTNINILGKTEIAKCRRQGISIINGDDIKIDDVHIADIWGTKPMFAVDIESNNSGEHARNISIKSITAFNCVGALASVVRGNELSLNVGTINFEQCEYGFEGSYSDVGDATSAYNVNTLINANNTINISKIRTSVATKSVVRLNRPLKDVFPNVNVGVIEVEKFVYDANKATDETLHWNVAIMFADRQYNNKIYGNIVIDKITVGEIINKPSIRPFIALNRLQNNDNYCEQHNVRVDSYQVLKGIGSLSQPFSSFSKTLDCVFNKNTYVHFITENEPNIENGINLALVPNITIRELVTDAVVVVKANYVNLNFNSHITGNYAVFINGTLNTNPSGLGNIFNMLDRTIHIKRNDVDKTFNIFYKNYDILNMAQARPVADIGAFKINPTTKVGEWFDGTNWYNIGTGEVVS